MKDVTDLGEWVDPSTSALIVIDVQNDFCHDEGAFGKLGTDMGPIQEILPRLENLMEEARGAGCKVVIFRVARSPEADWPAKRRLEELNFGPDAVPIVEEGSWGAELCEGFEPKDGDVLLTKNRYGGFTGTNLDLMLRNLGVKTIIMTGVATNVCVESTIRDAYFRDYDIYVMEDCVGGYFEDLHKATLKNVEVYFGELLTVDSLETRLEKQGVS